MTALQSKYSGWLMHLTAWAVVFGMPLFFVGAERPLMTWTQYLRFLIVPLSFMTVFYLNYFVLIERNLFAHKLGRFILWNVLLIAAVMIGTHLFFHLLPTDNPAHPHIEHSWQDVVQFMMGNALLYMLVVGASVAIRMTGSWYRTEAARQELEHSKTEAELQHLKSQLNPHFLFNTLNNIYSLIQIDTERAQQAVHDLSRMLRYVLYDSSQPTVPLKAEVEFLRDYIELMRIRQPRHVKVKVSLPEDPSLTPIAPLLFISLVENAFKHGVSNDQPSFVTIDLHETEAELTCTIDNSYFPKTTEDQSGSGIGLSNLSKRLEMIYPGRYKFSHGQEGETYHTLLQIKLH